MQDKRAESEEIDKRIAELMAPDEEGAGKKKKGRWRRRKKTSEGSRNKDTEKVAGESAEISGEQTEGGVEKKQKGRRLAARFKMLSRRKKAATIVAAAALLLFAVSRMGGGKEMGIPVSVIPLAKQDIQEKLTISGPVSGTDSVDVVSNIHAEITAMNVKEGDKVTKGQVLAVLDSTDLEREVLIAKNAYDLAVANKEEKDKEAALGYEKAVQDYQKASLDYSRNSQLFVAGDISQVEMEQITNGLHDAKRQMESFTVEDGKGVADRSYEIQVANAAFELEKKQEELENTQIKSTIDGTVVRVNSKVGQFADKVEDDKPIFSIENLEQLELEIKVSEFSIGKVKVGQKAVITADILDGGKEEGEVIKISPTGEEKGGGSTERVIPTTIRVEGQDTKLIAGITAKAELLIREAKDAFVVPASAVFEDGDSSYIAVAEDGKVRRIPVSIGVDGDVSVEIIPSEGETLEEGMQVITNPSLSMTDGAAVSITQL